MLYEFLVLIRALWTGGMTIFSLESEPTEHADAVEFVHPWRWCHVGSGNDERDDEVIYVR